jgi:hypothetical protein
MDKGQQDLRRTAAKEFMRSLEQLGMELKSAEESPVTTESQAAIEAEQTALDGAEAKALEEAVADIEQFIQAQAQE